MSDNTERAVRWTRAARKHHIGKAAARHVMTTTDPARTSTLGGASGWQWIGPDDRGRELEIIAIEITAPGQEPYLLVIHVMPTQLRGGTP